MTARTSASCVCGHTAEAHEHYRAGSDCSLCSRGDCRRYRPVGRGPGGWWAAARQRWAGRTAADRRQR